MEIVLTIFGILGYALLWGITLFCYRYTKYITGSILNITTCLSIPLLVICTFQFLLAYIIGVYAKPDIEYWLILCLYILLTAIIESSISKATNIKKYTIAYGSAREFQIGTIFNFVLAAFIIYACYDSYRVVSSIDLAMLLQDEGQDDFGMSAGGGFYARVFLMIMATYYLGYGNNWKNVGLGLLCLFPSLVINTKGVIFIPIIAAFIVRYLNGNIKNVRKAFFSIGIIGAFIFFASYMWEFFTIGGNPLTDSYRWQLISEKLLYYLTSGVQGFSANLSAVDSEIYFSKADNITIAPFANFLSKFGLMENIRPVAERIQYIGKLPLYGMCDTNVNTYMGTIYLYNSFIGGIALHFFWVTIVTIIKIKAIKNRQPFTVCLFALFATGYVLGWFDLYFMQTFWVYMIVMVVILNFINSFKTSKHARI